MTRLEQGAIWGYDYLWHRQHEGGETEGRKQRPTALVAVAMGKDGKTNPFILPITSKHPGNDRLALEIPDIERRRGGLDADRPLWVMLDEYNHDLLETSFYFDPRARIGKMSAAFHRKVLAAFTQAAKQRRVKRVPRA